MVLKRINRRGSGELTSVVDGGPVDVGVGVDGFLGNGNDSFVGGLSVRLSNNDDASIIDTQSCWDGQSYYDTTQTFAGGMSVVSNDSSSMYTKNTTANEGMATTKNTICPEQSNAIRKTRIVVCVVLLLSSITVCTISYTLMTKILLQQQHNNNSNDTPYHQQYEWTAKQILEEFQSILPLQIIPIIETLQDVIVASADEILQVNDSSVSTNIFVATTTIQNITNTSSFVRTVNDSNDVISIQQSSAWPSTNMMKKFPYRTNTIRTMSPLNNTILSIAVYPVVDHSIQHLWNDYSTTQKSIWMNASLQFQNSHGINTSTSDDDDDDDDDDMNLHAVSSNSANSVSNIDDLSMNDTTHTSNYTTPLWQISPYTPEIRNYIRIEANSITQSSLSEMLIPQKLLKFCTDNSKSVIGNFVNSVDDASKQYLKTLHSVQTQSQQIDMVASFEDDPYSQIAIPFHSVVGTDAGVENTTKTQPVVTIVVALLRWKKYLERIAMSKIVPDCGAYELILSSSCEGLDNNSTSIYYTFRANGNNIHFVGLGDLHDSQWDQYKRQIPNQLDMFNSICSITLAVYPTDEVFVNIVATTNGSNVYAIIVLVVTICMFLSIGIVFKVHDLLIERRHDIVLNRAALSTTLVRSLFPGEIATRVMNHQTRDNNNNTSIGHQVSNNSNNNPSPIKISASQNMETNLTNQSSDGTTNIRHSTILPKFPVFGNNFRIEQAQASGDDDSPSAPNQPKTSNTRALAMRLIRSSNVSDDDDDQSASSNEPIADLFPNTTVFFADIAGFTAWSSTRDPTAVFKLLQGVYQAFDKIAKRLKVFKVETIGDSYVAVTGLPQPQENHAVIMARFAYACKAKMTEVTSRLELQLGPGTSDLVLRTGLHSGPVTGGVLMGEKARFQLFGDTVNTASRMESTGIKEKIQLSTSTATLLTEAGKGHWVVPRADKVIAKGKGEMQTYWLEMENTSRKKGSKRTSSNLSSTVSSDSSGSKNIDGVKDREADVEHVDGIETGDATDDEDDLNQTGHSKIDFLGNRAPIRKLTKNEKLVSWICELLRGQIQKVAVTRTMNQVADNDFLIAADVVSTLRVINPTTPPIDEVVDYLDVPEYSIVPKTRRELAGYRLDTKATEQLHQLVTQISSSYNDNAFHNFEHACYVVMSVSKLLRRINPSAVVASKNSPVSTDASSEHSPSRKAGYTYGVHSDPITQLALLFAALIHDIDHRGVSNKPLMIEEPQLAVTYKNTSVAEQNSIDIAWSAFMSDSYEHLRSVIFHNNEELWRFRRVVVNAVLATDILDPHSNENRENRWKQMFQKTQQQQKDITTTTNAVVYKKPYQAAIVVEYMMQASDVSHTMQHWLVYIKWNTNLLREVYTAHTNSRLAVNPIEYWYQSELDFFDHYVIPLAQKLKSSHAFGSSITEYLTYAKKNRAEWAVHGHDIINETIRSISASTSSINSSQTDNIEK